MLVLAGEDGEDGEQQRACDASSCGWASRLQAAKTATMTHGAARMSMTVFHGVLLGVGTQTGRRSSA